MIDRDACSLRDWLDSLGDLDKIPVEDRQDRFDETVKAIGDEIASLRPGTEEDGKRIIEALAEFRRRVVENHWSNEILRTTNDDVVAGRPPFDRGDFGRVIVFLAEECPEASTD